MSEVSSAQQSLHIHCCCGQWDTHFLKPNKKLFQLCVCETVGDIQWATAGCGTEVVWLTVWMESDRCTNSHLEAGENLPLGHHSSYPWLHRAFPSTPLTSKSLWQSRQPTSMAAATGIELWEPHCGTVSDTSATLASTKQWLITHVNGSETHQPRMTHEHDWTNGSDATRLKQQQHADHFLPCQNINRATEVAL